MAKYNIETNTLIPIYMSVIDDVRKCDIQTHRQTTQKMELNQI